MAPRPDVRLVDERDAHERVATREGLRGRPRRREHASVVVGVAVVVGGDDFRRGGSRDPRRDAIVRAREQKRSGSWDVDRPARAFESSLAVSRVERGAAKKLAARDVAVGSAASPAKPTYIRDRPGDSSMPIDSALVSDVASSAIEAVSLIVEPGASSPSRSGAWWSANAVAGFPLVTQKDIAAPSSSDSSVAVIVPARMNPPSSVGTTNASATVRSDARILAMTAGLWSVATKTKSAPGRGSAAATRTRSIPAGIVLDATLRRVDLDSSRSTASLIARLGVVHVTNTNAGGGEDASTPVPPEACTAAAEARTSSPGSSARGGPGERRPPGKTTPGRSSVPKARYPSGCAAADRTAPKPDGKDAGGASRAKTFEGERAPPHTGGGENEGDSRASSSRGAARKCTRPGAVFVPRAITRAPGESNDVATATSSAEASIGWRHSTRPELASPAASLEAKTTARSARGTRKRREGKTRRAAAPRARPDAEEASARKARMPRAREEECGEKLPA